MPLTLAHKWVHFFLGLVLIPLLSYSAEQERYLHFTETDGLPRNITTCLEQDQYGYLWIGTTNGIARYDGKNFYNYTELTGISIIYLLYDSHNTLWVASGRGLYKYNRLTNFFERIVPGFITKVQEDNGNIYFLMMSSIYKVDGDKTVSIYQGNELSDFCFSKEGIWIGKSNDGAILLSRESNLKKTSAKYLKNQSIVSVTKIDNKLFAAHYNGQLYSISDIGKVEQINFRNHRLLKKITKVGNEFWLATDGNGIIVLDKNLCFSRVLTKNYKSDASISSNSIYDIYYGSNNEIWIASYGAGLTCILPDNLLFKNILPEKGQDNSLIANEGVSVLVKKPYVYFGTNYGLSVWNENTQKFINLTSDKLNNDLKGTKVTAILADSNNNIWVGAYDGLLGKYSPDFKLMNTYHPSSETPDEMQQIVFLKEINKNNLLILTQFQKRILLNFNIEKGTTHVFELYQKGSNDTYCLLNSIRENRNGELLGLISDRGLFHIDWKNNILENRLSEMNKRIDGYILDFYQDKKSNYWFASSTGLIRISKEGKNYKKYTVKDGLLSDNLARIESVDDRFLWISTISGICRFDMKTAEVLNYNHTDGLPANEFLERVSAKTSDGRIIFGSMAGFTIIDPSKVNTDASRTEIIFSDITFQNQSIRNPEGKQFLKQPLEDTKEIWLPYNKNSFSIHFFAKNRSFVKYHNYAYRLIGLEKDWNYQTETNYATYTNLNPGKYTFEIKTADKTKEGLPTRLTIHIQSPWYLSWFAYIAYLTIFFTIIYLSIYSYLKRIELKKEKEISEFKIQKEHELTEKKLAFFTNVSHDLKTPLTLIDAPVNDLLQSEGLNQEQINKLIVIKRNSKRLYKLITDLLDFRKITQKQYVLEVKETAIYDIITDVYEAFKEECKNKSIELKCVADRNIRGFVDAKKIEKILWNLLSNALKFTGKGGTISLTAEEIIIDGNRSLKVMVTDSGIGISEKHKNKIFDRFYKVQNSQSLNQEGTGIGLSIVKELVEMHHGKVLVESDLGAGTTFSVILPSNKESYSENELAVFETLNNPIFSDENIDKQDTSPQPDAKKQYNLSGILVVEDNQELLEYLSGHFNKNYKVYVAEDGFDGLSVAKEMNPDVIITDVQMPKMNGYEFCKEIRRNFDTSHIPVVMLTANNTIEQQIEGLSTGADVYLTKPFDIKLLDAQVNSLLENRKMLRSKFMGIETIENLDKTLPQKDIDFILELKLFIEENIMKQDLSVELLSEHFSVSLAQLHRKIKALTGSTPNNLIKSIRLKKAYKLIREEGMRVSEAAYQTGFSDPNYFTTCFKKEFGENPSQIVTFTKKSNNKQDFDTGQPDKNVSNTTLDHPLNTNNKSTQNIDQLPLLLIAEDSNDMRNYILNEFKSQYRIIETADGESAYNMAISEIPDLIISDIMMPGIDGIEFCRKLKTDERTSHIPIVLLTAKDSDENKIEGLENGADDYISKPFNISILKARIKNLYQSRLLLRNKFMKEPEASVKEISPSAIDERFLKKAYEIVEKYISNPDFDVQIFSSELGMSRAQLYRKIDAVSGQSVHEFVRIMRLKKAAELLTDSNIPISEIVEKVGFNSFAYFTKSFKEYFGVTPSQYKK
jgi:DNA-binding response OmpR family regulator/signal transduction histidine kinase/ligand-binding sensor domain-containing protein